MSFDPDEFLGEKKKKESAGASAQGGFDPDKFLASPDTASIMTEPTLVAETEAPVAPGTSGAEFVAPQAASMAGRVAAPVAEVAKDVTKTAYNVGKTVAGYPIGVAKNALAWTPRSIMEVAAHPQIALQQYIENHPLAKSNASLASVGKQAAGYASNIGSRIGTGLVQGALAPESAFLMPYQMAAYEQEKIRENPNAPGLQYNPYAQTVRGEAATQGRAGAANQMRTVANMPYGNVSAAERAILDEDARIKAAVRKRALEKVMGPVAPGSF
jgi:hypothetical protein